MNKKLPYDICRCLNEDCPMKDNCARFTNFRDGHMRPIGGSPLSMFGKWVHDEFICDNLIQDV